MRYPSYLDNIEIIEDYYNTASRADRDMIDDALIALMGDLGFTLDEAGEYIITP